MNNIDKLSFEEALSELEILARRLEEGKCPLDDAVKTFERGIALKNHCEQTLKNAKLKVDQVLLNGDSSVTMKPFEDINQENSIKNVA